MNKVRTKDKPHSNITSYNESLPKIDREICNLLRNQIDKSLPDSQSKIWHGHPVWFLNSNPIVGYAKLKTRVQLLFWSGQSFDEVGLKPEGSFKAAEANYTNVSEINLNDLTNWLEKSKRIQWDYKNIVKRKGQLERL